VVVAALLGAAAALAGGGFALTDARTGDRQAAPSVPLLGKYLAIVLVLLVIAIELVLIVRSLTRNDLAMAHQKRSTVRSLLFLGTAFLVVYLIVRSGHLHIQRPQHPPGVQQAQDKVQHAKNAVSHTSQALGYAVTAALALVILAIVGGLLFLWRAGRGKAPPKTRLQRDLIADLRAAELELEAIQDPRLAVLACYERMQRTLERGGLHGSPADTPAEIVARVRQAAVVEGSSPERLAALFEHAKFSPHPVGEEMRREALAAVTDIREQLEAEPDADAAPEAAPA
jgi:hypothetical protein